MKQLGIICMALMVFFAGCSQKQKEAGEVKKPKTKALSVDELVQNAEKYEGKMVTVEGRMGDICSDGEDFYFKGKFDLIEVIPPEGKMPSRSMKGKPLVVYGKVKIEHEEAEESEEMKEEEHEKEEAEEPEAKIEAREVKFQ